MDFELTDPRSYKVCDLIQILREISHLSMSPEYDQQKKILLNHDFMIKIMLTMLTRDYIFEGANKNIDVDDFIPLMHHVLVTLANLTTEHNFCS
jgi:hypothetical protein